MDLQRNVLMRYLHERGEMSRSERIGVEWLLFTQAASRKEYAEMEQMHRALSLHFAPQARVAAPTSPLAWLRIGFTGLTGAIIVAGSLVWMQEPGQARRFSPATAVAVPANVSPGNADHTKCVAPCSSKAKRCVAPNSSAVKPKQSFCPPQ